MEAISKPLKIYFLPFMAQGHMIPLVHLARLFATRGEEVTIITTPSNAKHFSNSVDNDRVATSGHHPIHIHIHIINFPSKEVGLPDGVENMSSVADNAAAAKICTAAHLLQPQVEAFVEANPPHVVVTDMMFTWSAQLTSKLGIPRLVFNAISIFNACMIDTINKHYPQLQALSSDHSNSDSDSALPAPFVVPGLPHPITLTTKPSLGFARMSQAVIEAEHNSLGVVVNSFPELEAEYAEHYEKLTGRKVWHVGPAFLMLKHHRSVDNMDKLLGQEYDQQHDECLNWLNSYEHNSIVYISFGSLCRFPDDQLFEIACGMEASGHKFLWVVHRKHNDNDRDKWLPQGFEDRMREENKGMIIRGWAPQVLILNHPAIGGFLTHCGWNATAEAIVAGVPMVTMPGFGDQFYNEKLITQVRGFGVEVGAQEWSPSPYDAKKKVVGRERIEKAVRRLMDGGDEGMQVRRRAKELQEKAWIATEKGGSSHRNLRDLIQQIKQGTIGIKQRRNY